MRTTRIGELPNGKLGSIQYTDLDGDGVPELKKTIDGEFKLENIEWRKVKSY